MSVITSDKVTFANVMQIELSDSCIKKLADALKQKTGHWIDKSKDGKKNSECSECHTLFRVLNYDYPYCPVCGSKNGGEEENEID